MITELKPMIDKAESVSIILSCNGKVYSAVLITKGGDIDVPPLQVTAEDIEELDNEISKAFNEGAESYAEAVNTVEQFKAAAKKQAEGKTKTPTGSKSSNSKSTPKKKAGKTTSASAPVSPDSQGKKDGTGGRDSAKPSGQSDMNLGEDEATLQAMKDLGLE